MTTYKTGTKLEKHQAYVEWIKERIQQLEQQKGQIDKELIELRQKLEENENYRPED